jgi:hypothetical protein
VFYRKYHFAQTGDIEEFRKWQEGAAAEAARLASVLAELYVNSIATLTSAGDLVVTLGDVAENGPRWDQLISILPLIGHLPLGAIILKLGNREVKIPKALARKLEQFTEKERKSILVAAAAAKTDDEAEAIIKRGLAALSAPEHHIATNKNWISTLRGGPWTPKFQKLFEKAGLTLEDAANKVRIPAHAGPHPEAYHKEILDRLDEATRGKRGSEYKAALLDELHAIAREANTPGTKLNTLLTK